VKILVTLFEIQDYGGIAQSHELMVKGLVELGHDVHFVILRCNDRDPYVRKPTGPRGSYPSVMGGEVNTLSGWYGQLVMGYGSTKRVNAYRKFADTHDLVIHQIPVPKPDAGGFWKRLYNIQTTQIAWIHDANFRDLYPHLVLVADKLAGVTTSNQAGYESAAWLPCPRAFMGVPHELLDWKGMTQWRSRRKQAVCAHVWKAWKRMHLVVQAIPLIRPTKGQIIMGGDGIEGRYMRSKDKCKPRYKGTWKRAMRAGMDYRGLMTHDEIFELYQRSRVMIDLSYSKRFAELGSHFNRSLLEAYNCGMVPVVTDVNMMDNFDAQRTLWEDGKTHIAVPTTPEPEEVAHIVEGAMSLHKDDAKQIVTNGRRILKKNFEYRQFARDLIRLAGRRPCGVYPELETGEAPDWFPAFAREHTRRKAK